MKGIILAGGKGTRLRPATYAMNKHMVPILNRPMIEYPLGTLKQLGCKEILIVSGGDHIGSIAEYFGDGSADGVDLTYKVQQEAGGIAQALALAEGFANGQPVAVILGDNVFEHDFTKEVFDPNLAHIFLKEIEDPSRFGVYSAKTNQIVEKPKGPGSGWAVTGVYLYPRSVFKFVKQLTPSARGELEITDVNNWYLKSEAAVLHNLGGFWSDAGTPESLAAASQWALGNLKK